MKLWRRYPQTVFAISLIGLAGVSLALIRIAPIPFVFIGALWSAAALAALILRAAPLPRKGWVCVTIPIIVCTCLEVMLASESIQQPKIAFVKATWPENYFRYGGDFGYAPNPGVWKLSASEGDRIVYSVDATINADGLRFVPGGSPSESTASALFFGGSYTFGEGLADEESLPAVFQRSCDPSMRAYNFGLHGYGPHHMHAQVRTGFVKNVVKQPPAVAIYSAIRDHRRRPRGEGWDRTGPWYEWSEEGGLTLRGNFSERPQGRGLDSPQFKLLKTLRRSGVFRLLHEPHAADLKLFLELVEGSQALLQQQFPGIRFVVVLWDRTGPGLSAMAAGRKDRGIEVFLVSDIIPEYGEEPSNFFLAPSDHHPNAEAYRRLGTFLASNL